MPHAPYTSIGSAASSCGDDGGVALPPSPHLLGPFLRERIATSAVPLFIASVSFFLTFATVGHGVLHRAPHSSLPLRNHGRPPHPSSGVRDTDSLIRGLRWLCEVGSGGDSSSILASSLMSLLYGLGAALTLDEFALWLNLRDVYFVREGRSSFDAIILSAPCLPSAPGVRRCSQLQPRAKGRLTE